MKHEQVRDLLLRLAAKVRVAGPGVARMIGGVGDAACVAEVRGDDVEEARRRQVSASGVHQSEDGK